MIQIIFDQTKRLLEPIAVVTRMPHQRTSVPQQRLRPLSIVHSLESTVSSLIPPSPSIMISR